MKLILSPSAGRGLADMPAKEARRMMEKLEAVAADPFGRHPFAKALKGGGYAIRQGAWRAVYYIDRGEQTVLVDDIGNRREIYR